MAGPSPPRNSHPRSARGGGLGRWRARCAYRGHHRNRRSAQEQAIAGSGGDAAMAMGTSSAALTSRWARPPSTHPRPSSPMHIEVEKDPAPRRILKRADRALHLGERLVSQSEASPRPGVIYPPGHDCGQVALRPNVVALVSGPRSPYRWTAKPLAWRVPRPDAAKALGRDPRDEPRRRIGGHVREHDKGRCQAQWSQPPDLGMAAARAGLTWVAE